MNNFAFPLPPVTNRRPVFGWYKLNPDKSINPGCPSDTPRDNMIVKHEEVGGKFVSTVFLGLDHNHSNTGAPVVFETMIFKSNSNFESELCERYCTYNEALAGHKRIVRELKEQLGIKEAKKERLSKNLQLR